MAEHSEGSTEQEPFTYWGWISPQPGLVAGYVRDGEGKLHLYAVLKYPPITTTTMRGIALRSLDNPQTLQGPAWPGAVPPPTPQQVAAEWNDPPDMLWETFPSAELGTRQVQRDKWRRAARQQVEGMPPEVLLTEAALTKRHDEPPDFFYARVGAAYQLLAKGSPTPSKRIAEIAGVKQPAATSWVHRARKRGFIPEAPEKESQP